MSLNSVILKFYSYFVILNLLFWVVWNVYRIREFSYCWKYTHFLSVISSKPCSECNKWFQIIGNSKTLERFCVVDKKFIKKVKHSWLSLALEVLRHILTLSIRPLVSSENAPSTEVDVTIIFFDPLEELSSRKKLMERFPQLSKKIEVFCW